MTVDYLIDLLNRRILTLSNNRASAESNGDLDRVIAIDAELSETQETLSQLQTLA